MTAILNVTTPAATTALTTLARARTDLNLATATFSDPFVTQMIDTASAAIVAYLNIAGDGDEPPTIGRETLEETIDIGCEMRAALVLARAPIADVASVDEDGILVARLQSAADGAVDVGADATEFSSTLGPDGAGFNSGHVGKAIVIAGAGAGGASHATTIAAVLDAQTVTLTNAALTTVSGAAYTIENPAFAYEWRRGSGLLYKLAAGYRAAWTARRVKIVYSAGWLLPGDLGRNLPGDIEDACILLIRRKIEQIREADNPRLKGEAITGIGSWTFDLSSVTWEGGLPSDVTATLSRYKRRVV